MSAGTLAASHAFLEARAARRKARARAIDSSSYRAFRLSLSLSLRARPDARGPGRS